MKTVLVTGASSGMGRETAQLLAKHGYAVYGGARRVEKIADLAGVTAIRMDVTSEADLVAAVKRIESESGGVDILVNNAGFGLYGPVEDLSMEQARYQFDVNLFGLARLTQLVLPYMRENRFGKIINISSMGGRMYTPLGAWYHATKHALEGWSDCLRLELEPLGIDVVIVEPGLIETEFSQVVAGPLLQTEPSEPYKPMYDRLRSNFERGSGTSGSPASLIANVIYKALTVRRPRTRYVAGKFAKFLIRMRRLVGDRAFDRLLTRMF